MKLIFLSLLMMTLSVPVFAIDVNQTTVISNAMGTYMGSNRLDDLVKWTIGIAYLLWMAWMSLSSFSSWSDGQSSIADLSYSVINAAVITMLVVWVIT